MYVLSTNTACSHYLGTRLSLSPHINFFKVSAMFYTLCVYYNILLVLKNTNKNSGHLGNQEKSLFLNILYAKKNSYHFKNKEQFLLENVPFSRYRI